METFTLEELRHMMLIMNSETLGKRCEVCDSARVKLDGMIQELKSQPILKEIPEDYKKLGVVKWEVIREEQSDNNENI